jgi:RAB protein geranylgeranyltransferase component A
LHLDKVGATRKRCRVCGFSSILQPICGQNDYYGSRDASFTLDGLYSWVCGLPAASQYAEFHRSPIPPLEPPAALLPLSRKFSLDINPRFVLSRGDAVDLLVRSETTHYLDFKTVEALLYLHGPPPSSLAASTADPRLSLVPASKTDVFQHPMGALDKRRLMKFIQVRCVVRLLFPVSISGVV